jgi:hypothetical protein
MRFPKARPRCWRWRQRHQESYVAKNAAGAQLRLPEESSTARRRCRAGVRKPALRGGQGRRRRRHAPTCRIAETAPRSPATTSHSRTRGIPKQHRQATHPKKPARGFGTFPIRSSQGLDRKALFTGGLRQSAVQADKLLACGGAVSPRSTQLPVAWHRRHGAGAVGAALRPNRAVPR